MFKALWFFIKIALLIAATLWLADHPGTVTLHWMEYRVTIAVGFALAGLIVLLVVTAQLYRLWRNIIAVPDWYRRYMKTRAKEKGYAALTAGLVAVAAGDAKTAKRESKRAEKLIPAVALVRLLSAQTALLNGDKDTANKAFHDLLRDEKVAFFGVRGLLNQALQEGDHERALELVRRADTMQPKTKWIIQTLFDLEVQRRDWKAAEGTLYNGYKNKAYDKTTFKSHTIALHLARAELAQARGETELFHDHAREAWRLNDRFVPAVEAYVTALVEQDEHRKALKITEKAFKREDHPDLAKLWMRLMPDDIQGHEALERAKWVNKLLKWRPDSYEAQWRYAIAAMEAGIWGEARSMLERLEKIHPTERVYLALSDLEMRQFKDEDLSHYWLKQSQNAPRDTEWGCRSCHTTALKWAPLCGSCGAFNSHVWGREQYDLQSPHRIVLSPHAHFIEPPSQVG